MALRYVDDNDDDEKLGAPSLQNATPLHNPTVDVGPPRKSLLWQEDERLS